MLLHSICSEPTSCSLNFILFIFELLRIELRYIHYEWTALPLSYNSFLLLLFREGKR